MGHSFQPEIPLPPMDEMLTIPEALAFQCKHNPKEPAYVFTADENAGEQTEVTFQDFGRACDRVAQLIHQESSIVSDAHVVGIFVVTDTLQFQITLVGVMRAGLVPFPISPHLSPEVVVRLLKSTSAHDLIITSATVEPDFVSRIKEEVNRGDLDYVLRIRDMPSMNSVLTKFIGTDDFVESSDLPPLPTKSSLDKLALYLHSSGSTGIPKAIPQTHKRLYQWASIGDPGMRSTSPRLRVCGVGLPPSHTMGFYVFALVPIYHGVSTAILPPVDTAAGVFPPAPSPALVIEHAKRNKTTAMLTVPAFLHVWAQSEENVRFLASAEWICFSGGPISTTVGDGLVSAGVNLQSMYGATELGPVCKFNSHRGNESNWAWFEVSDKITLEWVDQGDGMYEWHFLIGEQHEPAIINRSDQKGFVVSDLFTKHPTEEGLWKIFGRWDDVIIHSSGAKTLPTPLEEIVVSSPLVKGAVMFGRGHDNTGILIEVVPEILADNKDSAGPKELRDRLWPYIESANKTAPKHSRIFKEMIMIVKPGKPLPRAAKGTVIRKLALQEYSNEIESLYHQLISESSSRPDEIELPTTWDAPSLGKWLTHQLSQMIMGESLNPSKDLFEQGCDSLVATFLQFRIVSSLKTLSPSSSAAVPPNVVYTYPTIEALAQYLSRIVTDLGESDQDEHRKHIDAMITQYSAGLSSAVLLTGTTGHLASHVLASLIENPAIHSIYAFNRPSSRSVEERHSERFKSAGLDVGILKSSKIRFIEGDLSAKNLGLSEELYNEIQRSVGLIIHSSWELNFNLTLASFEPHIRGVRNLIDFARQGPHASSLRFIFTSSISTAQSWDQAQGPYPETVVRDSKYAVGMGYGESKYVAERILESSGLNACSVRIGQLSGTTTAGTWATTDWFPILVKSSVALGGLPSAPGLVSWLPMDYAADAILDLAFTKDHLPFAINLAHPRPIPWNQVIEAVQSGLTDVVGMDVSKIPVISFSHWVDHLYLKFKDAVPEDLDKIPALKLTDFFRVMSEAGKSRGSKLDAGEFGGAPTLAIKNAKELSPAIQKVQPLQASEIRLWVEYWKEKGLLL